MTGQTHLAEALAQCRVESASWDPTYAVFLERLQSLNVGASAPKVGDRFPDFALPNAKGARITLSDLITDGPLVLSFNRGGWCPYCRLELAAWAERLVELAAVGGRFVAITGEVGGRAEDLRRALNLDSEILCDVDHGLALELGLAFYLGDELRNMYLERGLNLSEVYGTDSWFLPIPATYVLDTSGIIRFAYADPDFRARAEPGDVMAVVATLAAQRN
jgi:peroxiredoxin